MVTGVHQRPRRGTSIPQPMFRCRSKEGSNVDLRNAVELGVDLRGSELVLLETIASGQAYTRRELAVELASEENQEHRKQSKFARNKQGVLRVLEKATEPESLREICYQADIRDRTGRDALHHFSRRAWRI